MPTMVIDCPACSRKLRVPETLVGTQVKCPTCQHAFAAPTRPAIESEPPTITLPGTTPPQPVEEGVPQAPVDQASTEPAGGSRPAADGAGETEPCPYCGEQVGIHDSRCRYCGEALDLEEEDDRPWEQRKVRGRRDAEPHRGTLILVLGIVSIVSAALGAMTVGGCGIVGLPLGIVAWVLGYRDLKKMRAQLMDSEGYGPTQAGWICGIIGTIMSGLALSCLLVYLGFVFTMIGTMKKAPPQVPVAPRSAPAPAPEKKVQGELLPQRLQHYLPRA